MPPKEIQTNYINGIVRLMLGYMYRLMSQQQVSFNAALQDHVDIYRKTAFYNLEDASETLRLRPQWEECRSELERIFQEHLPEHLTDGAAASKVEDAGLRLLAPSLAERTERGLPLVEYRDDTNFGCFFFYADGPVIDLHLVNKVMPLSPFENMKDRSVELNGLLEHCRTAHPEARDIKFGSWLNGYAPFRKLFPSTWSDSGERKSYNSLAWWGQFMNRYGDFHAANAAKLRETGRFPYQCTFHQCSIQELRDHLAVWEQVA